MALPRHITPDRFVRVAITALTRTPALQKCTQESLFQCLVDLSSMGLEPDGRKAHLIPYGDKCTLVVDYKGLVDMARRSGQISDIHADVVCENDCFEYSYGTDGKLVHRPALESRGKVVRAYSFVKLKDGSVSYEVMNREEIEAIRKKSRAGNNGPWVDHWNEMAKKTVFRRHSKWLPLSSEFQEAIDKDYDAPADFGALPAAAPASVGEIQRQGADFKAGDAGEHQDHDNRPKRAELLSQAVGYRQNLGAETFDRIVKDFKVDKVEQLTDNQLADFNTTCAENLSAVKQ